MTRFNSRSHATKPAVATVVSPMGTTSRKAPDTRTFEGAPGWQKNPRTDLFLRASASFQDGKDTFYEDAGSRDATLRQLAQQVAVEDFAWFAQFVGWLRRTANIRTAALTIAADGAKARLDAGLTGHYGPVGSSYDGDKNAPTNRSVIDSVLYRADEPGEMIAYWTATYGRKIPKPVKRGVADAVRRLYTERALLKYDTASHGVRFGDVLNLVHASPDPDKSWQGDLFQHALDRRFGNVVGIPESLRVMHANFALREDQRPDLWLDAERLNKAGMTWEDVLSAVGSKVDKAKLWGAMIPSMGYMALIRNLRNFDESGISNQAVQSVIRKLVDPDEVAKSRQLPFRFYSAYRNAPSLRWGQALETALDLCLPNIPYLPGRTLVMVDTSGSMSVYQSNGNGASSYSTDGKVMNCLAAAALFGSALALKAPDRTTLITFDTSSNEVNIPKGGSVLRLTDQLVRHAQGGGTYTAQALQRHYAGHDRVIILTDEQTHGYRGSDVAASVPGHVPVYSFCLVGYSASAMPTGSAARFQLGGLSDQTFKLIPLLEQGDSGWPWEVDTVSA